MKVLYTFGGMPHYLNAMLNKLQAKGVDIVVVTPQKGNASIGKGVKMVESGSYKRLTRRENSLSPTAGNYPEGTTGYSCNGMALLPATVLSAGTKKSGKELWNKNRHP